MTSSQRSALVGGVILILLGVLFLAGQFVSNLWSSWVGLSWPLTIVAVGVLLLIIGLVANAPGMAVPACVVGGIGLLLFWQNQTGNWESWAYAWALIPGFVGVGTIVASLWEGKWSGVRGGLWLILISAIMFAVFGSLFGGLFGGELGFIGKWWPLALILLGVLSFVDYLYETPRRGVKRAVMRNASVFFAIVLILIGLLFLLNNFGLLPHLAFSIWDLVWPIILIVAGIWLVSRRFVPRADTEAGLASIPLGGASRAQIKLAHGVGELRVAAGLGGDVLADGTFGGGLRYHANRRGELLDVEMQMQVEPMAFVNWTPGSYDWDVRFNPDVPLILKFETGASRNVLDLGDLKVTELKLETGASTSQVTLPANAGYTRAKVQAGAARVDIRVPGQVAARIKVSGALASVSVDQTRFPGFDNRYQSPDYDDAANKVEIEVETGVGAVSIS